MASWNWLKEVISGKDVGSGLGIPLPAEGYLPPSQDTLAAIEELSRVVKNNPDAVEIYLALGNLYRSQGEIERAVHIRSNLIVRPGLAPELKGKALYELGRDFKRAGLMDRSMAALEKARTLAGDDPVILTELARLTAETGDFKASSQYYSRLGHSLAEAHYMVRQAKEKLVADQNPGARKLLKKALAIYPGSVEAWIELVLLDVEAGSTRKLASRMEEALSRVKPGLRFLLPEMILQHLRTSERGEKPHALCADDGPESVLGPIEKQHPDVLLHHYAGLLLLECNRAEDAKVWFEKSLVLAPDFWPARLEILELIRREASVLPELDNQLEFFTARARRVKRFICSICGLKREQVFFVCPRCQSWHSISYRMNLSD